MGLPPAPGRGGKKDTSRSLKNKGDWGLETQKCLLSTTAEQALRAKLLLLQRLDL